MWDFEDEFDDLDLGSRRKPVEWVAVAPPLTERNKNQVGKRCKTRIRSRKDAKADDGNPKPALSAKAKEAQAIQADRQRLKAKSLREEKAPELASGVHNRTPEVVLLEAEDDEGNVEYKLRLKQPNHVRFQQLVTQMQYRLSEGSGECFYYLGVEDDGYPRGLTPQELETSCATLRAMADAVNANVQPLREMPASKGRVYLIVRISRICLDELTYTDLRVAVAGGLDSGKSTLVAVLTNGQKGRPLLDNGQGSARMNVFKHKHEIESGRTSSLSHHMLAYDGEHGVLNYAGVAPMMPSEIATAANKVVRFIDLGGHPKYLKTALYGLTSLLPDYVLLCVCPLTGMTQVAREHLAVALALELPLAFLITKVDIAPPEALNAVKACIGQILEAASSGHSVTGAASGHALLGAPLYTLVTSDSQAAELAATATRPGLAGVKSVPMFTLAATTGQGLSTLHTFLSHLQPRHPTPSPATSEPKRDNTSDALGGAAGPGAAPGDATEPGSPGGRMVPSVVDGADLAGAGQGGIREELRRGAHTDAQSFDEELVQSAEEVGGGHLTHFQVDQIFEVRGVGSVVSGTLVAGSICLNQQLLLGTTAAGSFTPVIVTSIQRAQVPVKRIKMGQHATLAIHALPDPTPKPVLQRPLAKQPQSEEAATSDVSQGTVGTLKACHPSDREGSSTEAVAVEVPRSSGTPEDQLGSSWTLRQGKDAQPGGDLNHTDRRHDTWQSTRRGSPFQGAEAPPSASSGSRRGSFSGDSEQGESPRVAFQGAPSQRLSAEEALQVVTVDMPEDPKMEGAQTSAASQMTGAGKGADLPELGARDGASAVTEQLLSDEEHLRNAENCKELISTCTPRKGTVLLEPSLQPRAVWQFEAAMVLLSGFWPARGLLSGVWPPLGGTDDPTTPKSPLNDLASLEDSPGSCLQLASPGSSYERLRVPRSTRYKTKSAYSPVVHCGSVRQAARVVSMAELPLPEGWQIADACRAAGCNLEPAIAAAASLLAQPSSQEEEGSGESCVAVVVFRFMHQPEWLQEGAKFVVRDSTESSTAGAGVVRNLQVFQ